MKRFLFVTGALLVAALGCDREPCAVCTDEFQARHVSLALAGCALPTKSSDSQSPEESWVAESVLYVFSRTGALVDSYASTEGRFDFYLTDELYDFVVVANRTDLPRTEVSEETLSALPVRLADNAVGNFQMAGSLAKHLIEADEKITVEVSRLVGKVSYTIRTAFTGTLAGKEFRVEDIYLTNVSGENDLGLSRCAPTSDALWYNRMDLDDPPLPDYPARLLQAHLDRRMAASDSLTDGPCFYPFPNESPDSHDRAKWGSRCTRLVVRATLGGRATYYPVTFPRIERNHHYAVDLTISNYGVEHPEDPVSSYAGVAASVTVAEWSDGGSLQGRY